MNNRIASIDLRSDRPHGSTRGATRAAVRDAKSAEGACSLLSPLHYEANYAYPLIVWLHPTGQNENVLRDIMPQVSLRNFVSVAPRGSVAVRAESRRGGKEIKGFGWRQSEEHIYLAQLRVSRAIDEACDRTNIHEGRIFLAGSGSGGTMALRVALANPQRFAGVLSLDGALPQGGAPLLRLRDARRLPVFVASGRTSRAYPPQAACDDLRLLYAAGMSVTLKEYPGNCLNRPQVYADVNRWIMEAIAEQKETSVVTSPRHSGK